jgi:hypothetical protein
MGYSGPVKALLQWRQGCTTLWVSGGAGYVIEHGAGPEYTLHAPALGVRVDRMSLATAQGAAESAARRVVQSAVDGASLRPCRVCDAAPGRVHRGGCIDARCPDCGLYLVDCEHKPGRPARWHGVDPSCAFARKRQWWTASGVADHARIGIAEFLGQARWDRDTQTWFSGELDEAQLGRIQGQLSQLLARVAGA